MTVKKVTRRDVLFLSISVFVLTTAWIGFSLYHSWVTTTITPELQQQIQQIDPTFDTQTITELRTREKVVPDFEMDDSTMNTVDSSTRALTLTPSPQASASAAPPRLIQEVVN